MSRESVLDRLYAVTCFLRSARHNKVGMIIPCRKRDIDPDRPKSEQKICLYTKDGTRLLGRHPSEESAREQERAIYANK